MSDKKWSWLIGLLGFLGFIGIKTPIFLIYFIFFGGFRYIWWNKIGTASDERLIENKNKAATRAIKITFIFILISTIILNILITDYKVLYQIQLSLFSLGFAVGINLWAYYTYQFENEE
ncbi:DUF3796 domain-containing protein [Macrococcus equi]|uniref:DUF3796 domain-containing protein n=1 Tax=Macrococcus equi TaxID=3395462 RepID=UPI0039BDB606